MRRRGRPGLLGTAARAAVAAGTVNAVSRRGHQRAVEQEQAAAWRADQAVQHAAAQQAGVQHADAPATTPGTTGGGTGDLLGQLAELGQLRDTGVLTPAEFEAMKARLLAGG